MSFLHNTVSNNCKYTQVGVPRVSLLHLIALVRLRHKLAVLIPAGNWHRNQHHKWWFAHHKPQIWTLHFHYRLLICANHGTGYLGFTNRDRDNFELGLKRHADHIVFNAESGFTIFCDQTSFCKHCTFCTVYIKTFSSIKNSVLYDKWFL